MPNYVYTCADCGQYQLKLRTVADRNKEVTCSCGITMHRELGEPTVRADTNFKTHAIMGDGRKIPGSFTGAQRRGWLSADRKKK